MRAGTVPIHPLKGRLRDSECSTGAVYPSSPLSHPCQKGTNQLPSCRQKYSAFSASIGVNSIYPTFHTRIYITTRSALALPCRNFSTETRHSIWEPWSMYTSSNCRPYTHFQLPKSLPTAGSRALPSIRPAWVLIRSP